MKKNKLCIAAFVLSLMGLVLDIIIPDNQMTLWMILTTIFSIISIVLGIIGIKQLEKNKKENGKGFAIAGIIISAIFAFIGIFGALGMSLMKDPNKNQAMCQLDFTNNCEKIDEETSKCLYADSEEIICKNEILKKEQYKK